MVRHRIVTTATGEALLSSAALTMVGGGLGLLQEALLRGLVACRETSMATLNTSDVYEGIPEMLQRLATGGVKLAILTSKDRQRTEIVLRRLPAEFATVQIPNPLYRGKPCSGPAAQGRSACRREAAGYLLCR